MWKLVVGFALFAGLALFILTKSGGNIDLSGEKHDVSAGAEHTASGPAEPASAVMTLPASAPVAASAASQ